MKAELGQARHVMDMISLANVSETDRARYIFDQLDIDSELRHLIPVRQSIARRDLVVVAAV